MFTLWMALVGAFGVACSLTTWLHEGLRAAAWFRRAATAVFIALVGLAISCARFETRADAFFIIIGMTVVVFTWAPFFAYCISELVGRLARRAMSLDSMRVPPPLSRAEGAERRQDYEKALRLYRSAAEEHPDEPEPCRRLAELYLKLDRPDAAIESFRDAQDREKAPGVKVMMTFAISEILADVKGDAASARNELQRFLDRHPESESRSYLEERIRRLDAQLDTDEDGTDGNESP